MLVLSRKLGETVCIGSDIRVSVLGIQGGRVRLGLSAPPDVPIHRTEIVPRLNEAATEGPTDDSTRNPEVA
jgi:carbon storage regulator